MEDEFKALQRLLRLKRYEMPPPEYFEDFLFEFHRRQRAELLKRPLWRLFLDRVEGALPTFAPSRYAYAGACATAVAATVLASSHVMSTTTRVASTARGITTAPLVAAAPISEGTRFHASSGVPRVVSASAKSRLNLASRSSVRLSPELDFDRPRPTAVSYASSRPRYVLDTQPVSYEQPFSF